MEDYEWAQNDIKQLIERFPMLEVRESFSNRMKRSKGKDIAKPRIMYTPTVPLHSLPQSRFGGF